MLMYLIQILEFDLDQLDGVYGGGGASFAISLLYLGGGILIPVASLYSGGRSGCEEGWPAACPFGGDKA